MTTSIMPYIMLLSRFNENECAIEALIRNCGLREQSNEDWWCDISIMHWHRSIFGPRCRLSSTFINLATPTLLTYPLLLQCFFFSSICAKQVFLSALAGWRMRFRASATNAECWRNRGAASEHRLVLHALIL